jgi:hypothetical protein
VLNLHIKSYPCTYRVVTYSPHKELCPLLQLFPSDTELFLLTAGHNVNLNWKILYRDYSFRFDPFTNMAATGNSCFRLVNFFISETALLK